jgi:hypothetical protein
MWEVLLWNSNPDDGNDDCDSGFEFESANRARAAFNIVVHGNYQLAKTMWPKTRFGPVRFVQLIEWGTSGMANSSVIQELSQEWQDRADAINKAEAQAEAYAKREFAHLLGMKLGIDAYNEAMGNG